MAVAALALAVGTANGNGYPYVVWENLVTENWASALVENGTYQNWYSLPVPAYWRIVGEADFLGDGNTDFVLENTIYQDIPTSKFDPSHTIWL